MIAVLICAGSGVAVADYVAEVSADNPTAWWRFEDASSASGSAAADSAGIFTGTYQGDIGLVEGVAGQSARFDGDFDYVDIGAVGPVPVQGSIEFWVRPDVVENYRNPFTTGPLNGATAGNHAFRFEQNGGNFKLYIGDDSGISPDYDQILDTGMDAGRWIHVVVTWDTTLGLVSAFIDGVAVLSDDANTFFPSQLSDVSIGMGYEWAANRCWMGNVDEVAIYDTRLGAGRIQAHHRAGVVQKIKPLDANTGDIFGWSVDIDGDTAIIGAHGNDDSGSNSGSAYIFEWDAGTGTWVEVTKLTASDAGAQDYFGYAVAVSGEIAVVSALYDDDGGTDAGAAYVFYRDQGGLDSWGEVTKMMASDGATEDWFGNEVDIDGDTVVVGTFQSDGIATGSGKAYIFQKDAGGLDNWGEVKILEASDAVADLFFGRSVGLSGDTIVVGAKGDASMGIETGAAYIFERDLGGPNNWGQRAKLVAADAAAEANFGYSSSIDGDLVIVGAFLDDGAAVDSGSAYVFERDLGGPNNWGQRAKLVPSDGAFEDKAALAVSIRGSTAALSSGWHDAVAEKAGAVYVYERSRGGTDAWGEVVKLTASDGQIEDYLGHSELVVGDGRLLAGTYGDDGPTGTNEGSVYVFETPLFADGFEDGTTDAWD
jgi:hypothetical protein